MTPGTSEAGRRVLLRRLYAEYAQDPAFVAVRAEAGGVLVPGDGPILPRLMFIGEAPGAREAKLRKPFVGASGELLGELLTSVGLSREEVFITNVVKYRPRENRDPDLAEVVGGQRYLWAEHKLLGYPPIVALGRHAARALDVDKNPVGVWGYNFVMGPVLYLRHPAYGIYQRANRPVMFEQFKAVMEPPNAAE
jgi:DNA polymerase